MASRAIPAPRAGARSRHLRVIRPGAGASVASRAARSRARRSAHAPYLLIGSTVLLTAFGLVMVLSASSVSAFARYGSSYLFFRRQALYAGIGLGLLVAFSFLPYRAWQRLAPALLGVSAVLLMVVLKLGVTAGGATRWLEIGPMSIQPSELAKLALIVFGASTLSRRLSRTRDTAHVAGPLLAMLVVLGGLVMLEPDLGTTTILAGIVFVLLFVAGIRLWHLAGGAMVAGGLGLLLIMTEGYRASRLTSFLNPWADAQHSGYQVVQSLFALGSGGWFGVGLGASRQKWMYVPNAHTDFIFSIIGEELGLVGALLVLALFGMLLVAGIRVAVRAPDAFGRLLAAGVTGWLGIQALVNLGAVTGLLPVTGVPLPLVSFGGSSLLVTLAAVGILVNIARSPARAEAGPAAPAGPRTARRRRR